MNDVDDTAAKFPAMNRDVVIMRFRMSCVAQVLMLALVFLAQASGAAEAKTAKQCEADASRGRRACNKLSNPFQCNNQVAISLERCVCTSRGGTLTSRLGVYECVLPPLQPSNDPPSPVKPKVPLAVDTAPPKSNPTRPTRPNDPSTGGSPPKSNPSTPIKPQGPSNVSAPKSNSSPGGSGVRSGGSRR